MNLSGYFLPIFTQLPPESLGVTSAVVAYYQGHVQSAAKQVEEDFSWHEKVTEGYLRELHRVQKELADQKNWEKEVDKLKGEIARLRQEAGKLRNENDRLRASLKEKSDSVEAQKKKSTDNNEIIKNQAKQLETFESLVGQLYKVIQSLISSIQALLIGKDPNTSNTPSSATSPYGKTTLNSILKKAGLDKDGNLLQQEPKQAQAEDAAENPKEQGKKADTNNTDGTAEDQGSKIDGTATPEAEEEGTSDGAENQDAKTEDGTSPDEAKSKKRRKYSHPGVHQQRREPTETVECHPEVCPECGGTEFEDESLAYVHQYVELLQQLLTVIHFLVYKARCKRCGKIVKGTIPPEFQAFFGPILKALIGYLDGRTAITRRQLQELLGDVFKLHMSGGAIQNVLDDVARALDPLYEVIGKCARQCAVNHADETSSPTFGPMGKHLHWIWVLCSAFYAYFMIHPHRSKEAFEKLIESWRGILISDDFAVYITWEFERQTCLAHLIRSAKALAASFSPEIRKCGKWLLEELKGLFELKSKNLKTEEWEALKTNFIAAASQFVNVGGSASNLIRRVIDEFDQMTLFLRNPKVDPTNNHAERMIRAAVCYRKISFGCTSVKGERLREKVLTIQKTCQLQGLSFFNVMMDSMIKLDNNHRISDYRFRKYAMYEANQYDPIAGKYFNQD